MANLNNSNVLDFQDPGTRTNLYLIALGETGIGKDAPRRTNGKLLGLCDNERNDKGVKLNSRRENVEGSPDADASRAHQRVRTWASAHGAVVTGRRSSAHCSARQCPLENPPVGTGESAGAHWTQYGQGNLQSPLGE